MLDLKSQGSMHMQFSSFPKLVTGAQLVCGKIDWKLLPCRRSPGRGKPSSSRGLKPAEEPTKQRGGCSCCQAGLSRSWGRHARPRKACLPKMAQAEGFCSSRRHARRHAAASRQRRPRQEAQPSQPLSPTGRLCWPGRPQAAAAFVADAPSETLSAHRTMFHLLLTPASQATVCSTAAQTDPLDSGVRLYFKGVLAIRGSWNVSLTANDCRSGEGNGLLRHSRRLPRWRLPVCFQALLLLSRLLTRPIIRLGVICAY